MYPESVLAARRQSIPAISDPVGGFIRLLSLGQGPGFVSRTEVVSLNAGIYGLFQIYRYDVCPQQLMSRFSDNYRESIANTPRE
jgi:hypothetical protein